jgi:hypothetical protein
MGDARGGRHLDDGMDRAPQGGLDMSAREERSGRVLLDVLRGMALKARCLAAVRIIGWGLAAAGLALVAVAWVDLAVELSGKVRGWTLVALGAAVFVGGVAAVVAARRLWPSVRVARTADEAADGPGEIEVGLDLSKRSRADDSLREGLRLIALERAGEVAASVEGASMVPLGAAFKPYLRLLIAAACAAVFALAAPRLATTQFLRVLMPWVDRPPYSPYVFHVEPGDAEVLYGSDVDVTVTFDDKRPEQLELLVEPEGAPAEVLPMFEENDGTWRGQIMDLEVPVRYTVRAAKGRSPAHEIALIYTPRLSKVRFRTTPPGYTGLSAWEGELPERGLSGLPGARVECFAESNRPLASGDFVLRLADGAERVIEMTPTRPGASEVFCEFEMTADAKFEMGVTDTRGLASADRLAGSVKLLKDERPFVRITSPQAQSFATPTAFLPVEVEADDDYGLRDVWLYRSLNDSRDLPASILDDERTVSFASEVLLPLAEYGLEVGDVLTFYARTQDNDPAAPKGAESEIVNVTIISQEDFDRLTRARAELEDLLNKYQSQARALEALKDRVEEALDKYEDPSALTDRERRQAASDLAELARALARQADETERLAGEDPLLALDEELADSLRRLAEGFARAASDVADASKSYPGGGAIEKLRSAAERLGVSQQDYAQNATGPLESFEKAYRLLEDQQRFVQLYMKQKELARRMQSMKKDGDGYTPEERVRMDDLAEEQAALKDELERILDDISSHAMQCPDDEQFGELKRTAEAFASAVRSSKAAERMSEAEGALGEPDPSSASDRAGEAEEILSDFISRCFGGNGGMPEMAAGSMSFDPSLRIANLQTAMQLLGNMGMGGMMSRLGNPSFARGGSGAGEMGGYSMMASSLQNVGIYGSGEHPRETDRSGRAERRLDARASGRSIGGGGLGEGHRTGSADVSSAGSRLESVPPEYRSKVEEYFRRVAEETAGRNRRVR